MFMPITLLHMSRFLLVFCNTEMMSELNECPSFESGRKPTNSLRIWKILTAVTSLIAVVVTAVLIWYVVTHRAAEKDTNGQQATDTNTRSAAIMSCPQLPTLFPLPKPTPKRITDVFEKMETTLSSLVEEKSSLPAISMNVFYQDDILWSGHFGSKVYKQADMKPNGSTVYRIGSVTKVFAVLLMYKLYEDGNISSIDDPLSKYAPDFAIKNPYTNESITLREIASQMSGLPREAPCMFLSCRNTTSAEQLALLKNRTLVLPPWNTPSYSNLGYALLGRLLTENLLNQTFESWAMDNIINPLGMVNTGFEITDEVHKNMAFPYLPGGKRMPFMNIGWLAPAGQIHSTIDDLAKLGMMFAQPDKQKLFKPATLKEMMTPKYIAPDGFTVWGSPFEEQFKEHVLVRTKLGGIDTYSASFSVIPELALGVNYLISASSYLQGDASKVASLYNLLISKLNETLFEIQRDSRFPIDPAPFIGKFHLTGTEPVFGINYAFNITVTSFENILRFVYRQPSWIAIRYIGESLVFQAKLKTPEMPYCSTERFGTLADLYYDPPGKDKLSPGFRIPGWWIVAKRITAGQTFMDRSEDNQESFDFSWFKSVI